MMAIGLLGTAISAFGTISAAKAQSDAAAYRAAVGRQLATQAEQTGERQAQDVNQKSAGIVGSMRAAAGASGLDVMGESQTDVISSAAELGMLDAQTTKHNAALRAWAYRAEASAADAESNNARQAGWLNATSTLLGGFKTALGGASSTSSNWDMWKPTSGPTGNFNMFSTQNAGGMGYW